jgi:hypothetical protein
MDEILAYILSWILDKTVPQARQTMGNRGCLLMAIVTAILLAGILPANYLYDRGEDWKTILIFGPLATILLLAMITTTFGIGRKPVVETEERTGLSATEELQALDDEAVADAIAEADGLLSARMKSGARSRCPECGHANRASAGECANCGKHRSTLVVSEV